MKVRFSPSRGSELVKPKIEEDTTAVSFSDLLGFTVQPSSTAFAERSPGTTTSSYDWKNWTLNFGLSDVQKFVNGADYVLSTLQIISETISSTAKILRLFSNDLKSVSRLLKTVSNALVSSIRGFTESLASTPLAVTLILPDVDKRKSGFVNPINMGFQEFKTRVSSACLNPNDPGAPKFEEPDQVGGIVVAGIAGQNDPNALFDTLRNFDILSRFFSFKNPNLSSPQNVTLKAGRYGKDDRFGVKVIWDHPGTLGIKNFAIFRSRYHNGYISNVEYNGKPVTINVFEDEDFNNNEPVIKSALLTRPKFSYIDYEVEEGVQYHYVVYSLPSKDYLEKVPVMKSLKSPLASNRVSIVARNCIPVSELREKLLLDVDGNPVDPDFFDSEWISLNVRSLLGTEFENILRRLERYVDIFNGWVTTGSDAITQYVDFYSNRIRQYTNIIKTIQDTIQTISQYRLGGSILYLELELENGGIENFVRRFNDATISPDVLELDGIYFGIVIVYGFPNFNSRTYKLYFPQEEIDQLQTRLDMSKSSKEFFNKEKERIKELIDSSDNAFSFLKETLFGGD